MSESNQHIESLDQRSEEVQELLKDLPSWIIRYGIMIMGSIVILFITLSWFIRYPDIIPGRITLTSATPPVSIVARATGRLQLYVSDQEKVKKGTILGVLENPASNKDVEQMELLLREIQSTPLDFAGLSPLKFTDSWRLGELQVTYNNMTSSVEDYLTYLKLNQYETQKKALEKRLHYFKRLNRQLEEQSTLFQKELQLAEKKWTVDSVLKEELVISEFDFDNTQNVYLDSELAFRNAESRITTNLIEIASIEQQLTKWSLDHTESIISYKQKIRDFHKTLESELSIWKRNYLIESPIDGAISFFHFVSSNQFVSQGDEILTIVPEEQTYYGEVVMSVERSGKVKPGQEVNIKLDGYPFEEYGIIRGQVESISPVPKDFIYRIRMSLTDGLQTTYDRTLDYRPNMSGNAEIITEDLNLLQRVFNQLRKITQQRRYD